MKKSNAIPAVAGMLKKCFLHLHLYPEKQTEECPAREILPAAVLRQVMQVVPDREVVAGKYRLKEISFVWTNIKRNNMMLY
jgi:hypothetical protein